MAICEYCGMEIGESKRGAKRRFCRPGDPDGCFKRRDAEKKRDSKIDQKIRRLQEELEEIRAKRAAANKA